MKTINIIFKILLGLLLVSPILGALGVFPKPTPDMYNTAEAYAFIDMLYATGYITYIMAFIFFICIILIIKNRMALVSLLILPITVNIVCFHLFLDGGLFTAGAIMANLLLILNIYFLWQNCEKYKVLWS